MIVCRVDDSREKRTVIELCDRAFSRPLASMPNKEEIIDKIDRYAAFFTAYDGEDVVGYAAIYANDTVSLTAYITMLGVVEEMRGRHVGSALMQSCIDEAVTSGMRRIRLEVLKSDTIPIAFYEHWGFLFEKDCTNESIYMLKDLL